MGIRAKILSGFLILATMLLVAGAWSIYELRNIGVSAQRMLDENYKSIAAAKGMTEALERQDSATLLILLGKREEGLAIIKSADAAFQGAFETARNNITLPGEQGYVEAVLAAYEKYRGIWQRLLVGEGGEADLNGYFRDAIPAFLEAKRTVSGLMNLNHQAMYELASNVEARAYRAAMPGIIAIVSAIVFSLIFSYLINLFFVDPIVKLSNGIGDFLERGKPLEVKVDATDEIARLITAVENVIKKCVR